MCWGRQHDNVERVPLGTSDQTDPKPNDNIGSSLLVGRPTMTTSAHQRDLRGHETAGTHLLTEGGPLRDGSAASSGSMRRSSYIARETKSGGATG
jgi:hypothetical protein